MKKSLLSLMLLMSSFIGAGVKLDMKLYINNQEVLKTVVLNDDQNYVEYAVDDSIALRIYVTPHNDYVNMDLDVIKKHENSTDTLAHTSLVSAWGQNVSVTCPHATGNYALSVTATQE